MSEIAIVIAFVHLMYCVGKSAWYIHHIKIKEEFNLRDIPYCSIPGSTQECIRGISKVKFQYLYKAMTFYAKILLILTV